MSGRSSRRTTAAGRMPATPEWSRTRKQQREGVHQVRVNQEVAEQAAASPCKEGSEGPPELDGLLVEGEEQEYFLELLIRRASPERPKTGPSARSRIAPTRGKKNRSKEKKARGRSLAGGVANEETKEEKTVSLAGRMEGQVASNAARNPEAKGGGLIEGDQQRKEQTRPPATSGGECSGQKTPDYS